MKDKLFGKAINWVKKKGFQNIKANIDDYETPSKLSYANQEKFVTPDITATSLGNKNYIDIAVKTENKQDLVSKWKLFAALAARKGGRLYLLAGRGHKAFTDNIVKQYNLQNAIVVSI